MVEKQYPINRTNVTILLGRAGWKTAEQKEKVLDVLCEELGYEKDIEEVKCDGTEGKKAEVRHHGQEDTSADV